MIFLTMTKNKRTRKQQPFEEYKEIPIDLIIDPIRPLRSDLSPESVEDLAKSIKSVGLIEPIVVRPEGNKFEVVAGHRRLLACQIAGLVFVPCRVLKITNRKGDILKMHENLYREDVSPIDEAKFFTFLKKHYNLSTAKIAKHINKSEAYVIARLNILKWPEDIRQVLAEKAVEYAVARELAKIDDDDVRRQYIKYAIENGITSDVAAKWRRDYQNAKEISSQPVPRPSDEEVPDERPRYVVTCAICGGEIDLKDAMTVYVHPRCYRAVKDAKG